MQSKRLICLGSISFFSRDPSGRSCRYFTLDEFVSKTGRNALGKNREESRKIARRVRHAIFRNVNYIDTLAARNQNHVSSTKTWSIRIQKSLCSSGINEFLAFLILAFTPTMISSYWWYHCANFNCIDYIEKHVSDNIEMYDSNLQYVPTTRNIFPGLSMTAW